MNGVIDTATQATTTAQEILHLFASDTAKLEADAPTGAILKTYAHFQKHPLSTTRKIKETTGLSKPTVLRSVTMLESMGILKEITGKERHKIFIYQDYLGLLNKGTEPISR